MEASCWKDIKDFLIPFLWVVEGTEGGGVAMVDSLSPLAFSLFLNGGLHLCTHAGIYAFNGFIVMIIARSNRCSSRTLLWSSHTKCHFSRVFVVFCFVLCYWKPRFFSYSARRYRQTSPLWLRDFSLIMLSSESEWGLADIECLKIWTQRYIQLLFYYYLFFIITGSCVSNVRH